VKVLLLNLPSGSLVYRGFFRSNVVNSSFFIPQVDFVILSGALAAAGAEVGLHDCIAHRTGRAEAAKLVREGRYDLVVCMVSSATLAEDIESLRILLQATPCRIAVLTDAAIVAAGLSDRLRQMSEQIACVSVEPLHQAVVELVEEAVGRRDRTVAVNASGQVRLPLPRHELFIHPRYSFPQSKRVPVTVTQFTFGCTFGCPFCVDGAWHERPRFRIPEDVAAELAAAEGFGVREAYFRDLSFGLLREQTVEMCRRIEARRLRLRWLCTSRVDLLDPELLAAMARAGCYGIEFGLESMAIDTRRRIGKVDDEERIRETFRTCRKLGIEVTAFVILGFPEEGEGQRAGLHAWLRSLGCDWVSFNLLTPFPGTPLFKRLTLDHAPEEFPSHPFHSLSWMNGGEERHRILSFFDRAHVKYYLHPAILWRRLRNLETPFEVLKLIRHGGALAGRLVSPGHGPGDHPPSRAASAGLRRPSLRLRSGQATIDPSSPLRAGHPPSPKEAQGGEPQ
jgi:tRNA A37 methylthiotransferase MiaB